MRHGSSTAGPGLGKGPMTRPARQAHEGPPDAACRVEPCASPRHRTGGCGEHGTGDEQSIFNGVAFSGEK